MERTDAMTSIFKKFIWILICLWTLFVFKFLPNW
jgi:hypothetical protein